ncbi:hemicentin-2-like, partial [Lingula anatina]|uniref:Hemicentin-2-like n=1 Tax=Lingula anatina TaxID=7574 RepID=A0A1S3I1N6_LINAN
PPSNVGITSNPVSPLLADSTPTLTCEASDKGNPAPNYRWWNSSNNDITDTESAGKSVITVGPLTDRDNRQIYHCEASNYYTINKPSTSPNATYTLNVEFNPIISTQASPSSTVKEGNDVTLTCDVTKANPTVTSYVWSRTQDRNNGVHNQASYTINQIQVEQNGTYTCYATAHSRRHGNLVGESSVTLTVKYLRVSVESIPATLENSSVSFHCKPEGIPGSFVYSNWQFLPLTGGQPVDLHRNQNPLVLNNAQYTDAGTYICTASNSQFTKTSNGSLAVKYAAKKDPSSDRVTNLEVSADIGESVTLTLYIIAYPKPTSYSWRKINGSLPSTYNQTDLEYASTLRVDKLSDSDYGTYVCSVDNGIGQSVFVFKLERKGKPDAPSNLEMFNISAISVTVQWISNKDGGYPQTFLVEYKTEDGPWVSTSAVLDPGYKQTGLKKVPNLQPNTNYMFRVESRNDHQDGSGEQFASGGYSSTVTVKTKVRPIIPETNGSEKPSLTISKDIAVVSWTAPEQGEVTSYGIKYCIKGTLICVEHRVNNSSTTFAALRITEGKEYIFTMIVYQGDDVVYESEPFAQGW